VVKRGQSEKSIPPQTIPMTPIQKEDSTPPNIHAKQTKPGLQIGGSTILFNPIYRLTRSHQTHRRDFSRRRDPPSVHAVHHQHAPNVVVPVHPVEVGVLLQMGRHQIAHLFVRAVLFVEGQPVPDH